MFDLYLSGALLVVFLIVFIGASIYNQRSDRKVWNNGICAKSGKPWIYFDTDSQGGRGYKDDCGNYCWISYPGVDQPKPDSALRSPS